MPYGPAARVTDATTHGSPLAPGAGSANVLIGSMPAWRAQMDFHACPIVKGMVPDVGGMVMVGSPTVLINSMMACRVMDMVVEIPGGPNPVAMGATNVCIGDAAVVAPSGPGVPAIPALKKPSLESMPVAAAAQAKTLVEAAKAGVPFCAKCQHITDGLHATETDGLHATETDGLHATEESQNRRTDRLQDEQREVNKTKDTLASGSYDHSSNNSR